jgi:carbon storage regulator
MLILTRRPNQAVMIGSEVIVTILEVDGHRVRLGIAAPSDIPILRDELVGRLDVQVVSPDTVPRR